MFKNDSLIQLPGVGNIRLPFLELRRFKEALRTLSATTDDQTYGEKPDCERQRAFSKDHGKSFREGYVQEAWCEESKQESGRQVGQGLFDFAGKR